VIVAARMDGVVLVLQANQTQKGAIKQTIELLSRARARILGMLYNQVQPHGSGYYYSHYRYYQNGHMPHGRNGKAPQPELESTAVVPAGSHGEREGEEA
jgi:Mrp family chromosome partitioning ATPase